MRAGTGRTALRWGSAVLGILLLGWALLAASGSAGLLGWLSELGANFRMLPVAAAVGASVLLGWSVGRWAAGFGGAACAVVLGLTLIPLPRLAGGSSEGRSLRLATWNACLGNVDPELVIRWIDAHRPDVIAFTEFTKPMHHALEKPLAARFPFVLGKPRNGPVGMMVFSRVPITNWSRPSRHQRWAAFDLEWPGGTMCRMLFVHPPPPTDGKRYAARAETLQSVADEASRTDGPLVVLGDMNSTWASAGFRRFCAAKELAPATNHAGSWPAMLPEFVRIAIDHVLASPRHFQSVSTVSGTEGGGGDHLPVLAEILLRSTSRRDVR
jgi:endonuclease/exonuclease/phosphatase (EEP) superfamily protein YafD